MTLINSSEHQSRYSKNYVEQCPPQHKCKLIAIIYKSLHNLTTSVTHLISTYDWELTICQARCWIYNSVYNTYAFFQQPYILVEDLEVKYISK